MKHLPRLLVSVRSCDEALAAMRGGADFIDVKEPRNGALGRADWETIHAIGQCVARHQASRTAFENTPGFSVALGELAEWEGSEGVVSGELLRESDRLTFVTPVFFKLGPAHADDWVGNVDAAMGKAARRLQSLVAGPVEPVAVSYADYDRIHAPAPAVILQKASLIGIRHFLLDTGIKDSTTLLDWLPVEELIRLRRAAADLGIQFGIAGRLNVGLLEQLTPVSPDIIGVRGAVCQGGDRGSCVTESGVGEVVEALAAAFGAGTRMTGR
ncbi:MAG: hypothetical protein KDA96_21425 [Planctomycetaceae bacterium]|nr:hypothetical protein [Planctomycetaceae bacterium]